MAHFNYIKPGGVWGLFSLLTSGLMSIVDTMLFKSINGDEGGVWAPHLPGSGVPTPIVIGGDGLQVLGPFLATDAQITITPGKFLTIDAGATFNANAFSIANLYWTAVLGGTITTVGTGSIQVATHGGIQVTSTGEIWVMPGGVLRLKQSPVFGASEFVAEAGTVVSIAGLSGDLAFVSSTYATWLFSTGTTLVWSTNSSATIAANAAFTFQPSSGLILQGLMNSSSTFQGNLSGAWTWGGPLSAPADVEFGVFCSVFSDAGSTWTDAGTHTNSGNWLFTNASQVTFDSTTLVRFNGITDLGGEVVLNATVPGPGPLANNLYADGQCRAWAVIRSNGDGTFTILESFNIGSATLAGQAIQVSFLTDMLTPNYVVTGHLIGPDRTSSIGNCGVLVCASPGVNAFILIAVHYSIGGGFSPFDFSSTAGEGYVTFAVFGRM